MMKKLLTLVLLFASSVVVAQLVTKSTVSNAGIELSNANYSISFTMGEPVVGIISKNQSINQGFWAGSLFVEPISNENDLSGILAYPNPMESELNIFTNNNPVYGITLFTLNGKMALKKKVETSIVEHQIDVSHLAQGMYILRLSIENENEEKLFKVIKR